MPIKSQNPIPADVLRDRICQMVPAKLKIPAEAMPCFIEGIRCAYQIFSEDAGKATLNEVHHEIDELVRAALRAVKARKGQDAACEEVARRVERLSVQARTLLNKRGTLPDAEALRDPTRQRDACETVARLGRVGAYRKQGRKRPGDKKSTTEVSVLYAPVLQQYPSRREGPAHAFVGWIEAAYIEATGKKPPCTANRSNPGPYAHFVQACLDELRASADAVDLINLRCWQSRMMRLRHLSRQWDKAVAAARLSGQFP
jgi:hypothetical protein